MCCTVPDLNGGLDVLQVTEEVKVSEVRGKIGDVFGAYGVIGGSGFLGRFRRL